MTASSTFTLLFVFLASVLVPFFVVIAKRTQLVFKYTFDLSRNFPSNCNPCAALVSARAPELPISDPDAMISVRVTESNVLVGRQGTGNMLHTSVACFIVLKEKASQVNHICN